MWNGIPNFTDSLGNNVNVLIKLMGACAAEPRSYHIAGGIPVEKELAIHS